MSTKRLRFGLAIATIAFAVTVGDAHTPQPGTLTDRQILEAIELGSKRPQDLDFARLGSQSAGEFSVAVLGPGQRIANAAWQASQKGRTFTAKDVSGSMRSAIWLFEVQPNAPSPPIPALSAEHTYIECQTAPKRIDPIREAFETGRWSNAFGGTFVGRRVNAYYNPSTLLADRDCRLFVVNDQYPRHYKIPADVWRKTF